MSEAPQERFNVTADNLRVYDWQARISTSQRPEIHSYCATFSAAADFYMQAGDELGRKVFSLLYAVASFHADYDLRGNPYGPMWSGFDGKRSLDAEDLSDLDLAALSGIIDQIQDPEFRARVADILWVTKKDFRAAKLAVAAFLQSAERLKTEDSWLPYAERLERAARISAIRGFETENASVVAVLKNAVAEFELKSKSGLLCHRLMSILLSLDESDHAHYAALAERLARQFAGVDNWHFSEDYWQIAEQWHRRAKNEPEAQRCQVEAAECNVSNGEAGLNRQAGAMFAAHWIGRGLEALRRAKANKTRIQTVHRRLLEIQKRIPHEMHATELEFEKIPGFRENEALCQEASREFVSGRDFRTALERFANVARPTNFDALKKEHAESSKGMIFAQLMAASSIDHTGKTADILPPLGSGSPEEQSEAQLKHLYNQARIIQWQMPVVWRIEPARQAFVEEHAVRRSDLRFLVTNNPFILEGHEGIYLRGIQAGFHGDWLVAMHLLIPQLEASIRNFLQQAGAITSGLRDGIQAEKDLKQLMEMREFEQVFGQDLLFDLRGIMIDRFGHNLRNQLAHGLIAEGGFYQTISVYLWWLTIHLCWRGFRMTQESADSERNPAM